MKEPTSRTKWTFQHRFPPGLAPLWSDELWQQCCLYNRSIANAIRDSSLLKLYWKESAGALNKCLSLLRVRGEKALSPSCYQGCCWPEAWIIHTASSQTKRSWHRMDQMFYCCVVYFKAYFLKIVKTFFFFFNGMYFICLLPFCGKMYPFCPCLQAIVTSLTLPKSDKCVWKGSLWKRSKVPQYISKLTHSWLLVWSCRDDCIC